MPRENKSIRKLSVSAGQWSNTKSKEIVPYPVLSRMSPLLGQVVKPTAIYTWSTLNRFRILYLCIHKCICYICMYLFIHDKKRPGVREVVGKHGGGLEEGKARE